MKENSSNQSYLDVSELLLKEHSPVFRPLPPSKPKQNVLNNPELVPQVSPVLEARLNFIMTPVFESRPVDPFKDVSLEQLEGFSLDGGIPRRKSKKQRRGRTKSDSTYYILNNELQNIIEENNSDDYSADIFSESDPDDDPSSEEEISEDEEDSFEQGQGEEPQNQSLLNLDGSQYEFKSLQWQCSNPKKELVSRLRQIVNGQQVKSSAQKIAGLKEVIERYLCQHEKFYFEDSMSSLKKSEPSVSEMLGILVKGIEQTFKRTIGGLAFEKRRIKLLRYLDKKKRRVWRKKVSYDCRKKVADGRLRIKGKFVTLEQAREQLGLSKDSPYSSEQIKEMLYKKLEAS